MLPSVLSTSADGAQNLELLEGEELQCHHPLLPADSAYHTQGHGRGPAHRKMPNLHARAQRDMTAMGPATGAPNSHGDLGAATATAPPRYPRQGKTGLGKSRAVALISIMELHPINRATLLPLLAVCRAPPEFWPPREGRRLWYPAGPFCVSLVSGPRALRGHQARPGADFLAVLG